jgi:hypothetical protein
LRSEIVRKKKAVKKKHLTAFFFSCMIPEVIRMEKIVRQSMLYDFYGVLLTDHQRQIYEDVVFGDMSLGEIAEEQGISRQGVHDLIRRCDRTMEEYESRLHLLDKFSETKNQVEKIRQLAGKSSETHAGQALEEITEICQQILARL